MYPALLQEWVTIQSTSSDVTQSEPLWLDMSSYLDLVAWLEVKQVSASTGTVSLGFQTCPSKDDSLFQNMNDTSVAISAGVQVSTLLRDTALCPLTKWLRWQLKASTASTWQATFRIWVAASQPGGFALQELMEDQSAYGGGPDYIDLGGGAGADAPPTTGSLPQHIGTHTSLQHKGPKMQTPRPMGQAPSLGKGVKMHHPGVSATPPSLKTPRYHGWTGVPNLTPQWKRRYVPPVLGAVHPVTEEEKKT